MQYYVVKQEIHLNKLKKTRRRKRIRRIGTRRMLSLKRDGKPRESTRMRIFLMKNRVFKSLVAMLGSRSLMSMILVGRLS